MKKIFALTARHFLAIKNPFEFASIFFWIILDVIIYGFMAKCVSQNAATTLTLTRILTNLTLMYIIVRGSINLSLTLFRDLSDLSFIGVLATPISFFELLFSQFLSGIIGSILGFLCGFIVSFVFFGFNIFSLGAILIPAIFSQLISSWIIGLITLTSLITFGKKAVGHIYMISWLLAPFCGVFFPTNVLPYSLQKISSFVPMFHVFNALDIFHRTGTISIESFAKSFLLNFIYLFIFLDLYILAFKRQKNLGLTRLELES